MAQEFDNSISFPQQNNKFEFKKIFQLILKKWYFFAISIFLGVLLAWLYNQYSSPEYKIPSSLIINQYESGIKRLSLSQNQNYDRPVDVLGLDHAGRLKSYQLNLNTLGELNWEVFWYEKTPMYGKDLYGSDPFKVNLTPNKTNLKGVQIYITQTSNDDFIIDVDAKAKISNADFQLQFSQKGKFGQLFENSYFNFIVEKVVEKPIENRVVFFVIQDFDGLALKYQKKLKVISDEKKPDLMELVFSENNAKRGVDYLNKLEQLYIEFGLDEKNRVAENTMKFIDSQLKSVTDSLSFSANKFTNFRTRTQSVNLDQSGGLVMQKQETLETERAALESRLEYLRSLQNDMNDSKQMKQVVVPSVFGITDPTLNTLVAKLSDLYTRREVLSFSVQEKAPSLILIDRELQLTHSMLAQNINSLITATETDLDNLIRRSGGFSSQLSLLPRTEQQLSSLKRSFDLNNELYTFLMKMRAESAITYASNQPDVKVLDPASLETVDQTKPMSLFNYLVGLLLGFFLPFSIIMLHDTIKGAIQSKEELQEMTRLPLSGVIDHNKGKKELVVLENPRSNITESFRLLRTNLKYILAGDEKQIIAVQSTVSGEGKSFVSMNLASILAMNNLKVLLVAVDMRMSSLHNSFKSNSKKGLSTFLSNQDSLADVIETTTVANLSYIAAGPVPPNPAELLENGNFEKLLAEAKTKFDYIILDSPPVSLVTDGIITGNLADVNLFVVRLRYSSKENIKLINEFESKKTLPNLSLVINDAEKDGFGSGNYYSKRNKGYFGG